MPVVNDRRPFYGNILVAVGLTLLLLGTGNWIVGSLRARPYAAAIIPLTNVKVPKANTKERLLEPVQDGEETFRVNRAKSDFYHLVRSSGRVMMVLGASFLLGGLLGRRTLVTGHRGTKGVIHHGS